MKYILFLVFLTGWLPPGCGHTPSYESDDTDFYNGEILLPDYVHQDTLIVTNAAFLNWAMEHYDAASDGDILDILCVTTEIIHSSKK